MKKLKGGRYTPKKPGFVKDINHPTCTCQTGHCIFHNYPYQGPLSEEQS